MLFTIRECECDLLLSRTNYKKMSGKPKSLQVRKSPDYKNVNRKALDAGRVSVALPGSLTVEAAIVMPLVLFFLLSFFSLFSVIRTQIQVQAAVERALDAVVARTHHQTDTPLTGQVISQGLLELQMRQELQTVLGVQKLDFAGTTVDLSQETAVVQLNYEVAIETLFFSLGNLRFQQRGVRRLWTGIDASAVSLPGLTWVYVTEYGTVYHMSEECSYLRLSIRTVSGGEVANLRNASGGRYYACDQCRPRAVDTVYITDYGDRYHDELGCSGLKRQIKTVLLQEVGDMMPCSKCARRR